MVDACHAGALTGFSGGASGGADAIGIGNSHQGGGCVQAEQIVAGMNFGIGDTEYMVTIGHLGDRIGTAADAAGSSTLSAVGS